MRSHFAGNAVLMTSKVQRLDPCWRAQENKSRTNSGRFQGNVFRYGSRGSSLASLALASLFAIPSAAYAVGAQPTPPQIATPAPEPAKPVEIAPAPVEKEAAPRRLGGM